MATGTGTDEPLRAAAAGGELTATASTTLPPPGLIRTGLILFALGVAAIVWTFIDFAFRSGERPLWQNLLCLLAPIGFAVALAGIVRNSRSERRAAMALVAGADQDHSPIREPVRPGRPERTLRWLAAAEATSWILLIAATIVKYTQGNQIAVHVLGPVHGALFTAYVLLALTVWWRLRWSLLTLIVVALDSVIPGGGFLVAHRADLRPPRRSSPAALICPTAQDSQVRADS